VDALARRCFSCGTCTNVCPTCYCFDVFDNLNVDTVSGKRERVWDSCQLKVFSEVAGGENFREHRSNRLRHRMFRKGKYIFERTGRLGCVAAADASSTASRRFRSSRPSSRSPYNRRSNAKRKQ